MKSLLILLCIPLILFSKDLLEKTYYIEGNDINISHLVNHPKEDKVLFHFQNNRYTKRIKSKQLIEILKSYNYNNVESQSRYIKFIKKSPIDLSQAKIYIEDFYLSVYPDMTIYSIDVTPRGYISSLGENFTINIPTKSTLSNKGILSIKTAKKKKLFFDYIIDAEISVFTAKGLIPRGTKLSLLNTHKKSVSFDKYRAVPIQDIQTKSLQSKHNIPNGRIITTRDVQALLLVKRNATVSVKLDNNAIIIEFSAKALQNGKLNDIITVQKKNGKKFKAVVIGKNKVEIR